MNRDEARALARVILHCAEGGAVQRLGLDGVWRDDDSPNFSPMFQWRKKPEPRVFYFALWENDTLSKLHTSDADARDTANRDERHTVFEYKIIQLVENLDFEKPENED